MDVLQAIDIQPVKGKKVYNNNRGTKNPQDHSREISGKCLSIFMKDPMFIKLYMETFVKLLHIEFEKYNLTKYFDVLLRNGKQLLGVDLDKSSTFNPSGLTLNIMTNHNIAPETEILIRDIVYNVMTEFQRYLHRSWFDDDIEECHEHFINTYIRSFDDIRYDTPFPAPNLCERKSLMINSTDLSCKESTDMKSFPSTLIHVNPLARSPVFCTTNRIIEKQESRNFEIIRLKLNHRSRINKSSAYSSCPAFLINVIIMYHNDMEKLTYYSEKKDKHYETKVGGMVFNIRKNKF